MNFLFKFTILLFILKITNTAKNDKNVVIEDVDDIKEFKKLLRTKTNVLVCFVSSTRETTSIVKVFRETAQIIRGQGTMVLVDCSGEAKKLCKKLKVSPEPHVLKHYRNGEFNKDYDRKTIVSSMVNFMRDPTGDIPWEEDQSASDILHIPDSNTLTKLIKQETKPIMVMFYAPWCGFCKTLKPEFVAAATELKNHSILAAIDVNKPENANIRGKFNITGFPTLLYFKNGDLKFQYEGENNKKALISFMKNPTKPTPPPKEPEWSEMDSEVVHLTTTNFDLVIKDEASALIMFYAPWCGHCKKIKPEYEKAAAQLKADGIPGMMAALDATKETAVVERFSIKGYPTLKYFQYGDFKFDVNFREASKIVEFMKDPKEPPPPPPPEKPWSDEDSSVVHLNEENFKAFLKKKKHVLVMFYAPWCGHCKITKPEFIKAAEYFVEDPKIEFGAVDCTIYQSLCSANDVSGYPTIKYFSYFNKIVKSYNQGRTFDDFAAFMKNVEESKSNSVVLKLNDGNFKQEIESKRAVLVMFFAPWCKKCKEIIPEYTKIASESTDIQLAIVDCNANPSLTELYKITGFPTFKLFHNGKFIKDYEGKIRNEDIKLFLKQTTITKNKEL